MAKRKWPTEVVVSSMGDGTGRGYRRSEGSRGLYPWFVSAWVDRYGPPMVALASTVLSWVTVQVPLGSARSFSGLELWPGRGVAVVAVVVLLLSWRLRGWVGAWCRFAGGIAIIGLVFLQLRSNEWVKQQVIGSAADAGNPLAEGSASAFAVTPGLGLGVALLAGVFLLFVEYYRWQMTSA